MFRTRPAVPHSSPPTPCPMHSDHAPNIFRTFSEYTPLISGLSAALVWLGARGCHHGGALLGVVSRVCGGPQPRLRRPSATTPVILGPSGTSRSRQAACVALLVMHFSFSQQMAEECVGAHPCSKFWKFDDHGGTLKAILERGEAVLRQPFRLKRTRRGRPRRRPARATHG